MDVEDECTIQSIDSNEELLVADPTVISCSKIVSENVSIDATPMESNRKLIKSSRFGVTTGNTYG